VVLTLPLLFAGLIFSGELARHGEIGGALAANLFGAMLGGFLEYNSMYWGFSSLYPLGLALYGLAYVCVLLAARRPAADAEPVVLFRKVRLAPSAAGQAAQEVDAPVEGAVLGGVADAEVRVAGADDEADE
ncbi:MAG TPA: hypothetical protein VJ739_16340, partial [Gemmataceae bacterium]|nr:hypothetical protein [Gemmataceae bacterium]